MNEEIKVSVITMAYNQKNYIAQTLESCINQKTNFRYEIVVHDDCSTDGTEDVIREYEKKYPEIIYALYEKENQYSKGVDVFSLCLEYAKGEFIAVCEGDDYWIDINKLQMQYDVMLSHSGIDMCAAGADEVSEDIVIQQIRPKSENAVLSAEEVILGGGRYIATATLFFRKNIFEPNNLLPFEKIISFDYSNQIKGSLRGGIYYIDKQMAVYRRATASSWTTRVEQNKDNRNKHLEIEKKMLQQLDIDTNRLFHDCIERRLLAYAPFIEQLNMYKEELIEELEIAPSKIYLWGCGMRGDAFQEFCSDYGISLCGICDKKNKDIGMKTKYGFNIVSTDEVLKNADCIVASNNIIADFLNENKYDRIVINIQKYMPLS